MAALPRQTIGVEKNVERDALTVRCADEGAGARTHENLRLDAELLAGFQHAGVRETSRGAPCADESDLGLGAKHDGGPAPRRAARTMPTTPEIANLSVTRRV